MNGKEEQQGSWWKGWGREGNRSVTQHLWILPPTTKFNSFENESFSGIEKWRIMNVCRRNDEEEKRKRITGKRDKPLCFEGVNTVVSRDGESFPALEPQCLASPRDSWIKTEEKLGWFINHRFKLLAMFRFFVDVTACVWCIYIYIYKYKTCVVEEMQAHGTLKSFHGDEKV